MASNALASRCVVGERQIADKSTHCNCNHDMTVVCHKEEPKQTSQHSRRVTCHRGANLHDEEAVKDLDRI